MPIEATTPSTIAATFDRWAIEFATQGDGLATFGKTDNRPIVAIATLTKFRIREEDGVSERSPLPADRITVVVPDVFAAAAEEPLIAQAMGAVLAAVQHVAQLQNKL